MLRDINIQLIEKIRKPVEGNRFLSGLLTVLIIILYPLILIIGLCIMVFAAVIGLFQNLTATKEESATSISELGAPVHYQWTEFTKNDNLTLYQQFAGEVRFGPDYLNLKSEPKIPALTGKLFGDWYFHYNNGILLQEWNKTNIPDTNLLYIDSRDLEIQIIEKNIPSVLWNIKEAENETLLLTCDTGSEILTYKIKIK